MIVLYHQDAGLRPTVHVAERLAEIAGPMIAEAIERSVRRHGRCRLGLSGGNTPRETYAWLAAHLPAHLYPRLRVTWVDERVLPGSPRHPGDWQAYHADSNLRLAYEAWLAHVPLPAEHVLPMTYGNDAKLDLVRFGRSFLDAFDGSLDVSILGCGPDGHIASLFPDHPVLAVEDICAVVHDSPKPPPERLTLTLPVLNRVEFTFLLAAGAPKAEVLQAVWSGDATLPLGRLRPKGEVHWVLDPPAAAGILQAGGVGG